MNRLLNPNHNRSHNPSWLCGLAAILLLLAGCSSPNVNPAAPKAKTGYVDFYVQTTNVLCWEVERKEPGASEFKTVYSELKPPDGGVLRLAFLPGRHQLCVTFLNRVIEQPAEIEVEVQDGRITPVCVTLTDAGSSAVKTVDINRGGTAYGRFGRRYKVGSDVTARYAITAKAEEPAPYQVKSKMPYAH
jgi:hypothetical protein